ncbi:putative lipoprotein [Burkholderia pseudomallei]|nr:putative lipoprotein [Burkholderia pseudomallei]
MKKTMLLLLTARLAACGKSEVPPKAELPTVEALAANPERLKELRQQCKLERARLGD